MLTHHGAHGKLKIFHLEDGGFNNQRDYKALLNKSAFILLLIDHPRSFALSKIAYQLEAI
ncbi:MAG: hypothetical protein O7C56_09785 [Rickettsia endosymbiont of Ixodes persulcatus]|nr:hypothetical protein [Rickettsia endosymbiont of Ixodes persulcatus]